MKNIQIVYKDSNLYELGRKFGQVFDNIQVIDLYNCQELLKNKEIKKKFSIVRRKLEAMYPKYLEETYGRAEGLNVDRDAYLLNICFEIITTKEACTDIIIKKNNKVIIGHNEDLTENENEMVLVKYDNGNTYFYELSTYNCPEGTTFGWNNYGIIYTVNSIRINKNNETGIPVWFILRDIVNSKDIKEIIKKIDITDCASAFSLNIVDSKTNKAYSIEKVLDKLDVIEINDKYIHTNHIIHEKMDKNYNIDYESTNIRFNTVNNFLESVNMETVTLNKIKNLLQYSKSDNEYVIRKTGGDEETITAATFVVDTETKKIQIYSHYDNQLFKMRLE